MSQRVTVADVLQEIPSFALECPINEAIRVVVITELKNGEVVPLCLGEEAATPNDLANLCQYVADQTREGVAKISNSGSVTH